MQKVLFLTFLLQFSFSALAFFYNKSSVLGEVEEIKHGENPLEKVFQTTTGTTESLSEEDKIKDKNAILWYFENIKRGEVLKKKCDEENEFQYRNNEEKNLALRSFVETFRYEALINLAKAIGGYAYLQGMEEADFFKVSKNLVERNCSQNLSIISHQYLIQNLQNYYQLAKTDVKELQLPSYALSSYFAPSLYGMADTDVFYQQTWHYALRSFRAVCSWSGDLDNWQLLRGFLTNPVLMAYIIRQIEEKYLQVVCDGFICRKVDVEDFQKKFPRMNGTQKISQDLEYLYCNGLVHSKFTIYKNENRGLMKKWVEETLPEEEKLMESLVWSLITRIPEGHMAAKNYNDILNTSSRFLEGIWNRWSKDLLQKSTENLFFEDSIIVEKVPSANYFKSELENYAVDFEVTQGEMDRLHRRKDKLALEFDLTLNRDFLDWVKQRLMLKETFDAEEEALIAKALYAQLEPSYQLGIKKLVLVPWKGDLLKVVVMELLNEIKVRMDSHGLKLLPSMPRLVKIPLRVFYGPLALKYLHYRFKSTRGSSEIDP